MVSNYVIQSAVLGEDCGGDSSLHKIPFVFCSLWTSGCFCVVCLSCSVVCLSMTFLLQVVSLLYLCRDCLVYNSMSADGAVPCRNTILIQLKHFRSTVNIMDKKHPYMRHIVMTPENVSRLREVLARCLEWSGSELRIGREFVRRMLYIQN